MSVLLVTGHPDAARVLRCSDVRFGSFASVWPRTDDFRSIPMNRRRYRASACLECAKNGLMRHNKLHLYSITSSAPASSVGGTVRPSALAALRLMTSSNLVGCWTGKSAGWAPLRILCTYVAVCRDKSGKFAP